MSYCWLPVGSRKWNSPCNGKNKLKNYRKLKCDFRFGLIPLCDFSSLKDHSRKRTHRYLANQILPQFLCDRLSLLCLYHKVPRFIFCNTVFVQKYYWTSTTYVKSQFKNRIRQWKSQQLYFLFTVGNSSFLFEF